MNVRSLKMVSGFIAFIFMVTNVNPVGYANTPELSFVPFKTLEIPAEFGQVTESVTGGPTAPALIHIQSAHGNYEAEKNIENLLGYIEKNSKVRLMLLEGAANKLQPELFRMFPDHPDFNRKVTDKLMQEGYLTGPESFLVESSKKFEGWGIENLESYKKDRETFIAVVKTDKTAQASLRELRGELERRFTTKLNKDLLTLIRQETALDSGTLSFEGWLKVLAGASKKNLKLDLSDAFYQNEYPFLVRYERLQEISSKIDREKAFGEAEAFIKELEKQGISADIANSFKVFLHESRVSSLESRAAGEYSPLRRAFDLAFEKLPKDFSMKSWPNWTLYAQHIILMQELEGKGLHEETLRLQERIQDTLAQTPDEKAYLAQARELRLLKRLFSLELTRSEYEELSATNHAPRAMWPVELGARPEAKALFTSAMSFYETAVIRENKMFQNALQKMGEFKEKRAVIVTGGFHTDGLKKLAAAKGLSYLQITPRITEVTKRDHEVYLRSILGVREFETSQMSAVLGSDPVAMETVLSRSEIRNWIANVRNMITGLISTESVAVRDALSVAFSRTNLNTFQSMMPSATTGGLIDRRAALQQQRRSESAKATTQAAAKNGTSTKDLRVQAFHGQPTPHHKSQKIRNAKAGRSEIRDISSQRQEALRQAQVRSERAKAVTNGVPRTKDHEKITALHGPNTKSHQPSQKARNAKAGRSEVRGKLSTAYGDLSTAQKQPGTSNSVLRTNESRSEVLQDVSPIRILAQHFSLKKGAATGSVNFEHLQEVGVTESLTGHSERRDRDMEVYDTDKNSATFGRLLRTEHQFGDTDKVINQKLKLAAQGDAPKQLLCVGEPRSIRDARGHIQFVINQLEVAFQDMSLEDVAKAVSMIAYEPIWAINTGLNATPEQAQEVHQAIRNWLAQNYSQEFASHMRILYGGSAKPENVGGLSTQPDIDGFLVGGASLKLESFSKMGRIMAETAEKGNGRTLVLAANWKAEPSAKRDSLDSFITGLAAEKFVRQGQVEIIVAPPHTLLKEAVSVLDIANIPDRVKALLSVLRDWAVAGVLAEGNEAKNILSRALYPIFVALTAGNFKPRLTPYDWFGKTLREIKFPEGQGDPAVLNTIAQGLVALAKSINVDISSARSDFNSVNLILSKLSIGRSEARQAATAAWKIKVGGLLISDTTITEEEGKGQLKALQAVLNRVDQAAISDPEVMAALHAEAAKFHPTVRTVKAAALSGAKRMFTLGQMVPNTVVEGILDAKIGLLSSPDVRKRSEARAVEMRDVPALSGSVAELLTNFSDIVKVREDGVTILQDLKDNRRLFDLTRELTDNPNADVNHAAYWIASAITNARGVEMMSAASLYREKANLDKVWVIPATNMRAGGIIQLISFFESMDRLNAGGIAELAASEKGYSGLKTNEMFLAAAQIAHAFVGSKVPIIAQADHRQLKLDDIFGLDKTKIPEGVDAKAFEKKFKEEMTLDEREPLVDQAKRKKAFDKFEAEIRDMITARGYHIDLDPSTAVDAVLLKKLYAESVTPDNPTGLSKLMNEVRKRLEAGETLESIGHWIDDMPESELWDWVDQGRIERYREIHKHTIAATIDQIVKIRAHDEELKSKGLMTRGTVTLIGGEERHIDDEVLADKPSEVEGTLAFTAGVKEGLAARNAEFKAKYGVDIAGLDKISYQTGTAHGVAGRRVNTIVFRIHEKLLKVQGVQHGASKLTDDQFPILQKHRVGEVHLATQPQNIVLEAIAQKDPAMADVMWDLLVLFMKPAEESLTPVLKDYAAALKIEPKDLLTYAVGIQSNTVKFGQPEVDKKSGATLPPKWENFIKVVQAERGLDPNKTEDRAKILVMMVSDSNDVPGKVRSKLKDLVKYLCAPLLPYLTRMPEATEKEVIERLNDWQVKVYGLLGAKDSLSYFQQYSLGHVAPLPAMPQALAATIQQAPATDASAGKRSEMRKELNGAVLSKYSKLQLSKILPRKLAAKLIDPAPEAEVEPLDIATVGQLMQYTREQLGQMQAFYVGEFNLFTEDDLRTIDTALKKLGLRLPAAGSVLQKKLTDIGIRPKLAKGLGSLSVHNYSMFDLSGDITIVGQLTALTEQEFQKISHLKPREVAHVRERLKASGLDFAKPLQKRRTGGRSEVRSDETQVMEDLRRVGIQTVYNLPAGSHTTDTLIRLRNSEPNDWAAFLNYLVDEVARKGYNAIFILPYLTTRYLLNWISRKDGSVVAYSNGRTLDLISPWVAREHEARLIAMQSAMQSEVKGFENFFPEIDNQGRQVVSDQDNRVWFTVRPSIRNAELERLMRVQIAYEDSEIDPTGETWKSFPAAKVNTYGDGSFRFGGRLRVGTRHWKPRVSFDDGRTWHWYQGPSADGHGNIEVRWIKSRSEVRAEEKQSGVSPRRKFLRTALLLSTAGLVSAACPPSISAPSKINYYTYTSTSGLTPADLTVLPGQQNIINVFNPGRATVKSGWEVPGRGLSFTFNTGSDGYVGAGLQLFTPGGEGSADLSSLSNLRFELYGRVPNSRIKLVIKDITGVADYSYLDGISSVQGRIWQIPLAMIRNVDLKRIRTIEFMAEGSKNTEGELHVNYSAPARSEMREITVRLAVDQAKPWQTGFPKGGIAFGEVKGKLPAMRLRWAEIEKPSFNTILRDAMERAKTDKNWAQAIVAMQAEREGFVATQAILASLGLTMPRELELRSAVVSWFQNHPNGASLAGFIFKYPDGREAFVHFGLSQQQLDQFIKSRDMKWKTLGQKAPVLLPFSVTATLSPQADGRTVKISLARSEARAPEVWTDISGEDLWTAIWESLWREQPVKRIELPANSGWKLRTDVAELFLEDLGKVLDLEATYDGSLSIEDGVATVRIKVQEPSSRSEMRLETKFEEITTPQDFAPVLQRFGFEAPDTVQVVRLKGSGPIEGVMNNPEIRFAVGATQAEAVTASNFTGIVEKDTKDFADGAAVDFVHHATLIRTQADPHLALVMWANEGKRDGSFYIPDGRIYWAGYRGGYKDFRKGDLFDRDAFLAELQALRSRGNVSLKWKIDDAVEKTAGMTSKESKPLPDNPTDEDLLQYVSDSNTFTALVDDDEVRGLIDDNTRVMGIAANSPGALDISPLAGLLDIYHELARLNGIDPNNKAAFGAFMSGQRTFSLGDRPDEKNQYGAGSNNRHAYLITEAARLQPSEGRPADQHQGYAGYDFATSGDGNFMPGLMALIGFERGTGTQLTVPNRYGSTEGNALSIAAANIEGAQFPHFDVSKSRTNKRFNPEDAQRLTPEEEVVYTDLGADYHEYLKLKTKKDLKKRKGKGIVVVSSLTGASAKVYGEHSILPGLFQRPIFRTDETGRATVTVNTIVVARDGGAYLIRTTYPIKDLARSRELLKYSSYAGRRFFGNQIEWDTTELKEAWLKFIPFDEAYNEGDLSVEASLRAARQNLLEKLIARATYLTATARQLHQAVDKKRLLTYDALIESLKSSVLPISIHVRGRSQDSVNLEISNIPTGQASLSDILNELLEADNVDRIQHAEKQVSRQDVKYVRVNGAHGVNVVKNSDVVTLEYEQQARLRLNSTLSYQRSQKARNTKAGRSEIREIDVNLDMNRVRQFTTNYERVVVGIARGHLPSNPRGHLPSDPSEDVLEWAEVPVSFNDGGSAAAQVIRDSVSAQLPSDLKIQSAVLGWPKGHPGSGLLVGFLAPDTRHNNGLIFSHFGLTFEQLQSYGKARPFPRAMIRPVVSSAISVSQINEKTVKVAIVNPASRSEVRGTQLSSQADVMYSEAIEREISRLGVNLVPRIIFLTHTGVPGYLEIYSEKLNRLHSFWGVTHLGFYEGHFYVRYWHDNEKGKPQQVNMGIDVSSAGQSFFTGRIIRNVDLPPSVQEQLGVVRHGIAGVFDRLVLKVAATYSSNAANRSEARGAAAMEQVAEIRRVLGESLDQQYLAAHKRQLEAHGLSVASDGAVLPAGENASVMRRPTERAIETVQVLRRYPKLFPDHPNPNLITDYVFWTTYYALLRDANRSAAEQKASPAPNHAEMKEVSATSKRSEVREQDAAQAGTVSVDALLAKIQQLRWKSFSELIKEQIQALMGWQTQRLTKEQTDEVTQIQNLTGTQIHAWTEMQMQALKVWQIQALMEWQIQLLTETQIQALLGWQIQALTETQIQAFTIQALTKTQIQALTKTQIRVLTSWKIQALSQEQRRWLDERLTELLEGRAVREKTSRLAAGETPTTANRSEARVQTRFDASEFANELMEASAMMPAARNEVHSLISSLTPEQFQAVKTWLQDKDQKANGRTKALKIFHALNELNTFAESRSEVRDFDVQGSGKGIEILVVAPVGGLHRSLVIKSLVFRFGDVRVYLDHTLSGIPDRDYPGRMFDPFKPGSHSYTLTMRRDGVSFSYPNLKTRSFKADLSLKLDAQKKLIGIGEPVLREQPVRRLSAEDREAFTAAYAPIGDFLQQQIGKPWTLGTVSEGPISKEIGRSEVRGARNLLKRVAKVVAPSVVDQIEEGENPWFIVPGVINAIVNVTAAPGLHAFNLVYNFLGEHTGQDEKKIPTIKDVDLRGEKEIGRSEVRSEKVRDAEKIVRVLSRAASANVGSVVRELDEVLRRIGKTIAPAVAKTLVQAADASAWSAVSALARILTDISGKKQAPAVTKAFAKAADANAWSVVSLLVGMLIKISEKTARPAVVNALVKAADASAWDIAEELSRALNRISKDAQARSVKSRRSEVRSEKKISTISEVREEMISLTRVDLAGMLPIIAGFSGFVFGIYQAGAHFLRIGSDSVGALVLQGAFTLGWGVVMSLFGAIAGYVVYWAAFAVYFVGRLVARVFGFETHSAEQTAATGKTEKRTGASRSEVRGMPTLGPTRPDLEAKYKAQVEATTPDYVKRGNQIFDITNPGRIEAVLKHAHLYPYKEGVAFDPANPGANEEGLGLMAWLEDYEAEAKIATAGIRLTQNILYPWDTRNRINEIGIAFATLAKALVSKELFPGKNLEKIAGGESRYNTRRFVDMIARIQAAQGIRTYTPVNRETTPIWMVSMLTFMYDLVGAEHVTSSHAGSNFSATKDINNQGSQYLPEESARFVGKIREMFETARTQGEYRFKIAAANDPLIDEGLMKATEDGTDVYVEYLKNGVATDVNLGRIRGLKEKIIIDNVGGSMYRTMTRIFKKLGIADAFEWFHVAEDPFFHGIGKELTDSGKVEDYTQDTTIVKRDKKTGETTEIPVMERMGYDRLLKDAPIGKVVLMTDPDGDRLVTGQVEPAERAGELKRLGVEVLRLDEKRILAVYSPNQSFFMSMVYHAESLKAAGLWDKHPRFIIMTTASSPAWREWAVANGVQVLNVPVGFKEIAAMMKKVEYQMRKHPGQPVIVKDVFGREVNLGVDPRMLFAGEESGGMIIGPEEMIKSRGGREAIAMREKSAGEALLVQAAMAAHLETREEFLSDYLSALFEESRIASRFDVRHDQVFYNQSEPDPDQLKLEKAKGEISREQNYAFFVNMVLSRLNGRTTLSQIIEILNDTFAGQGLRFDDLQDILFVGDGVYMQFPDKVLEIRPSGTDAKSKSYGYGNDKLRLAVYAQALGGYSGEPTALYRQFVDMSNFDEVRIVNNKPVFRGEDVRWELYQVYYREGLPEETYQPAVVNVTVAGGVVHSVTPAQAAILESSARSEARGTSDLGELQAQRTDLIKRVVALAGIQDRTPEIQKRLTALVQEIKDLDREIAGILKLSEARSEARATNSEIVGLQRKIVRLLQSRAETQTADKDSQAQGRLLANIPHRIKQLEGRIKKLRSAQVRSEARTGVSVGALLVKIRQLKGSTARQIQVMTEAQIRALTEGQIRALTKAQIQAWV
ncbi:MAG: triose-phosphate isomerase, partial [Candidatus Omnitrophota bacterium]